MVDQQTIAVIMPGWQRVVYRFAPWLCLLVFLLIAALVARPVLANPEIRRQMLIPMAAFFLTATIWAMATMTWFQNRIIVQFSYDGCTLTFSTVGRPDVEARPLLDISEIDEWREYCGRLGFQGLIGYRFRFRDRKKVYLDLSLARARELAVRVQKDRWPDQHFQE